MGFIKSIQTKMSHAIGDGCGTAHNCTAEYSEHKRLYYHNPNGMSAGTADTSGSYAVVLSHCRVCGKYSGRYQPMGFGEHSLPYDIIGDDLTVRLWETGEANYFAERARLFGDVRYFPQAKSTTRIPIGEATQGLHFGMARSISRIPIGGGSPVFGGEVRNYEIDVEATRQMREIMRGGTPWFGSLGVMVRQVDDDQDGGAGI